MKTRYLILLHALVWWSMVVYDMQELLAIPHLNLPAHFTMGRLLYVAILAIGYISLRLIPFYGMTSVVMPLIFKAHQYWRGSLAALVLAVLIVVARYLLEFWLFKPLLQWDNYNRNENFTWYWFCTNCLLYNLNFIFWGVIYFFVYEWYQNLHRQKDLENAKTNAELAFLKSQINPHFLFNTINDIYALAYARSDQTCQALLKLSGLLRYMLHESQPMLVPLSKEWNYLQDFMELQRIGFKDQVQIRCSAEGDLESLNIPPLILIPFVENAFKHGELRDQNHPIEVSCSTKSGHFLFECTNKIRNQQKDKFGGIGLQNVKRRLSLLYPDQHELKIEVRGELFICSLALFSVANQTFTHA